METAKFLILVGLFVFVHAAWQENSRPKMYVHQLGVDDVYRFIGNDSVTDYFRLVLRDGDSLLVGGRYPDEDILTKLNFILTQYVAYFLNASLHITYVPTWYKKSTDNEDQRNTALALIISKDVDISSAPFFCVKERLHLFHCIAMTIPVTGGFLFKQPPLSYVKNIFALPFDTTLWLTEIAILFVCVVLLYFIVRWEWKGINERRDTPEYDMIPNSFSDAILFVIGAVCNQGYATEPKGSPGKIIMLTVFITIIFLFTAYTACTVVLFQSTADNIKTLEDLYKSKITIATDDTLFARARFPTYTEKWRQKIYQDRLAPNGNQTNYFPLRTGLQRVRNEYFAFHIDGGAGFNAISDMYYEHEKCGLQIIKYMTETDAYTVAPIGTSFLKQFKIANLVHNLSLTDLSEQQRLTWFSSENDVKMCLMKGKDEDNCQNYVRIMAKTAPGKLLVCGTNSFKPMCREYAINTGNYSMDKEKSGQAVCPYDPHHNSTAIYVDGDLYTGTVADFSGMDPIIYREPLQTEQYDSMSLNAPNFVSSMTQGDFVYFFFRETAVEYINCGKSVFSRVARVCKYDRGGPHRFRNRWTSFLKSRLNCSVTGEFPFYFNEIQSTTELIEGQYGDQSAQLIYGTFTTPPNSISGSAVCAFSLQDIADTFEGNFKEQEALNSNWLPVQSSKVPDPRPGACHNDSRTLPDLTLNFLKSHSLMDESVPSFFGQPIVIRTSFHYRFTQIAVDPQVKVPGGKTYDVLFIGTDNGKVIKAVNALSADTREGVNPVVVEEIQVFNVHVAVRNLQVVRGSGRDDSRLIVVADDQVQSLRLHRCNSDKITSCSECVALQDPYCAWDKIQGKCRSQGASRWNEENYFYQSVASGQHTACPPGKITSKDAGNLGGLSSNQPKMYNQDSMLPSKDQPEGQVINIMQDKEYENSDPAVTAADSISPQYSVETLVMAVVAGAVTALVVGFIAGYLCGRKCHKDEDDNLPYPDTEYEYFEQRQNINRIQTEPKLLPQEEVTYAEPVLVPQPPPKNLHSPKSTLRKGPHQNNAETLFQFQTDAGYNSRDAYRGRDNFGTLRSHQGDNYRRGDGFATTRSVKKVYL